MSRRQNKKFFDPTIFQKCWRGVGEQPTFAKQIKLYHERKQKPKRESEESQLPSKSEGCNESQGFRGNCDSQGKLGMCPSLAESDSNGFLKQSVSNHKPQATEKFFDPTIFQKCWRGSGRAALIAARRQRNPCAILLAHGEGGEKSDSFSRRGEQDNVINLKRLLNGKQNVWKYQNGEEKSDSDGREKDV